MRARFRRRLRRLHITELAGNHNMSESIRKLNGANMDIDLASREEASHGIRIGAPGTKQREQRYTGV